MEPRYHSLSPMDYSLAAESVFCKDLIAIILSLQNLDVLAYVVYQHSRPDLSDKASMTMHEFAQVLSNPESLEHQPVISSRFKRDPGEIAPRYRPCMPKIPKTRSPCQPRVLVEPRRNTRWAMAQTRSILRG